MLLNKNSEPKVRNKNSEPSVRNSEPIGLQPKVCNKDSGPKARIGKLIGLYQGKQVYSCTFDEILKEAHSLDPTIVYAIADRSKVGTKFLYYKGMIVGTLADEERIIFYSPKLCVPFDVWAKKELRGLASSSSLINMDGLSEAKTIITERPTIESMVSKPIELDISDLAQSLLDGVDTV